MIRTFHLLTDEVFVFVFFYLCKKGAPVLLMKHLFQTNKLSQPNRNKMCLI